MNVAQAKISATARRPVKAAPEKAEVRIFVSYSHADEPTRAKLETHLAALKRDGVVTWYDGDLNAGDALDTSIARELRRADLFVALLSPEYLASNYCWNLEYKRAMGRRARGTMRVVAIVVRSCDWKATQAAGFKLLPKDGKAVTKWRSADDALLDVTQGIRRVVADIRKSARPVAAPAKAVAPKAARAKSVKRPAASAGAQGGGRAARSPKPPVGKPAGPRRKS